MYHIVLQKIDAISEKLQLKNIRENSSKELECTIKKNKELAQINKYNNIYIILMV